jgi:hypothetical protein
MRFALGMERAWISDVPTNEDYPMKNWIWIVALLLVLGVSACERIEVIPPPADIGEDDKG